MSGSWEQARILPLLFPMQCNCAAANGRDKNCRRQKSWIRRGCVLVLAKNPLLLHMAKPRRETWGWETAGKALPPDYKQDINWGWGNNILIFSQGCKQISGRKTRSEISFQFSNPILHFLDHAIFCLEQNRPNKKPQTNEILIRDELWD